MKHRKFLVLLLFAVLVVPGCTRGGGGGSSGSGRLKIAKNVSDRYPNKTIPVQVEPNGFFTSYMNSNTPDIEFELTAMSMILAILMACHYGSSQVWRIFKTSCRAVQHHHCN